MAKANPTRIASARQHSPGPWRACGNGDCQCGQVWTQTHDHPVAVVTRGPWGDDWPTWRVNAAEQIEAYTARINYGSVSEATAAANARLIAAAPDLLEALKIMVSAWDGYPPEDPAVSDWPSDPLGVLNDAVKNDFLAKARAAIAKSEGPLNG